MTVKTVFSKAEMPRNSTESGMVKSHRISKQPLEAPFKDEENRARAPVSIPDEHQLKNPHQLITTTTLIQ